MRISDWSSDVCSSDLFFHIGVVEALWNEGVLPTILAGSSGGSIGAAIACTRRDRDIGAYLAGHRLANPDRDSGGGRIDPDKVADRLAGLIPDLTFQQAFEVSGRHLNVSVAPAEKHQNGRLLNAITAPNVLIREAVLASCAVPGVFPPVMLMARGEDGERVSFQPDRRRVDGSVTHDIPR